MAFGVGSAGGGAALLLVAAVLFGAKGVLSLYYASEL
jgi:hypothetical protein